MAQPLIINDPSDCSTLHRVHIRGVVLLVWDQESSDLARWAAETWIDFNHTGAGYGPVRVEQITDDATLTAALDATPPE